MFDDLTVCRPYGSGSSTTTAGSATLTLSSTASIVTGITVSATNSYETVSGNTSTNVTTLSPINTTLSITYSGTSYNVGSLSTNSAASTLATGTGILYSPNLLSNGSYYNVFAFGMANSSGSSSNNYTISFGTTVAKNVYVFAVGGGGGTSHDNGGGGGGGGVVSSVVPISVANGQITVSVGQGGTNTSGSYGNPGVASTVTFSGFSTSTVTAGGGVGGAFNSVASPFNNTLNCAGGASGSPQSYSGGIGGGNSGGGGAGAGGQGNNSLNAGGNSNGGIGAQCSGTLYGVKDLYLANRNVSYWYWGGGGWWM